MFTTVSIVLGFSIWLVLAAITTDLKGSEEGRFRKVLFTCAELFILSTSFIGFMGWLIESVKM